MKKIYSFIALSFLLVQASFSQCVIDNSNTAFFSPSPDSVPCVERGVPYDQVIQIKVPTSIDLADFGAPISFILTVDSFVVTDITGFPSGLTYTQNPSSGVMYGGDNGCGQVQGTTNDPVGNYPLSFVGFISLHGLPFPGIFDGDTTIDLATLQTLSSMFSLSLDVIEQGDPCRASGVKDFSAELNSAISVYPNPTSGPALVSVNTARRLNGSIQLMDVNGKLINEQLIDVVGKASFPLDLGKCAPGVYSVVLRTNEGYASKIISKE
jgi:hypothetical protein